MTLSVVVPVYNVAQYLCNCLDSFLYQTLSDFEVILVNDNSSDNSGQICEQYASKDPRIIVFNQPSNQGVSSARNKGIELASGEWITFIDSDDYVFPDYLEMLCSGTNNTEMLLSGELYFDRGKKVHKDLLPEWSWNVGNVCTENDIKYIENITSLHGKLFRRDIILDNRIHFDEALRYGEDRDFCITYLSYATRLKYLFYAGYCYRTDVAGSLSKQRIENMLQTDLQYWNKVHRIIGESCAPYQVNRLYNCLVDNLVLIYKRCGLISAIKEVNKTKQIVNSEFL